jgi:hypothetical protein
MSIMFSQTTRLELTIVAATLLVLLLCRQPPKSGNADVRTDAQPTMQELTPGTEDGAQETNGGPASDPLPATGDQQATGLPIATRAPSSSGPTSDNGGTASAVPPQPRKRMAMVDARNCSRLKYKDVLYGEVTVRWVWNGKEFVPRKVIEVKEKNGVTSIWSFDEHKDIVLSEIRPDAP